MESVIYKYVVGNDGTEVPVGEVLHVGYHATGGLLPTVWVRHSMSQLASGEKMTLQFVGTGHKHESSWVHLGSCQIPNGLVWHVFREKP